MPGFRLNDDGSLTVTPERKGDAERLAALYRAMQEQEAAIAHGLCNVELMVKVTFKSPSDAAKAAQLRRAAPCLSGARVITTGPGAARGG